MAGRFTARRVTTPDMAAIDEPPPSALEGIAWTVFPDASPEPPPSAPAASAAAPAPAAPPPSGNPLLTEKLLDAKVRLHRRLIEEINLSALEKLP